METKVRRLYNKIMQYLLKNVTHTKQDVSVSPSTTCRTWHGQTKIQSHIKVENLGKANTYQKQSTICGNSDFNTRHLCRSRFNRPSVTHGGHALFGHHTSIGQQHISCWERWIQLSNQCIALIDEMRSSEVFWMQRRSRYIGTWIESKVRSKGSNNVLICCAFIIT